MTILGWANGRTSTRFDYPINIIIILSTTIVPSKYETECPTDDREQLLHLREKFVRADNAGNVEGVHHTVSDDIVVMPSESPPVSGKKAERWFFEAFLNGFTVDIELASEPIVVDGNLAYDWGGVSGTFEPAGGLSPPVSNTYLLVYQRNADGAW